MTFDDEDAIRRWSVASAIALAMLHTLTAIGTEYQRGEPFGLFRLEGSFEALIVYGTLVAPVVILLLARNFWRVVVIYGTPVLVFFVLRMHLVWQFYCYGINSMARQKGGDDLGWFTLAFEMLSVYIAAAWLIIIAIAKLLVLVERVGRR